MSNSGAFGSEFRLTLITDDPRQAAMADEAGVNLVGVDLEQMGKSNRQAGHATRISGHSIGDLKNIGGSVRCASLFARVNPLHAGSREEIEQAFDCGVQVLMLPFFRTPQELDVFVRMVDKRARVVALVETVSAVVRLRSILRVPGLDEVMVGLNDLRLEMKVQNHFEVLASPVAEMIAGEVHRAGIDFSIGGLARPDDRSLPIDSDLVIAQYPRLDATGAWVSRSFFRETPKDWIFANAIAALRARLAHWRSMPADVLDRARDALFEQATRLGGAVQPDGSRQ